MVHGTGVNHLPKNAREYISVGLGRAIHGAPRFWEMVHPGSGRPGVIESNKY